MSSSVVVQLKLKFWLKKLSSETHKGNSLLRF